MLIGYEKLCPQAISDVIETSVLKQSNSSLPTMALKTIVY